MCVEFDWFPLRREACGGPGEGSGMEGRSGGWGLYLLPEGEGGGIVGSGWGVRARRGWAMTRGRDGAQWVG